MSDSLDRVIALAGTRVGGYVRSDGTKVSSYMRGKINGFDVESINAGDLRRGDLIHDGDRFKQVEDARTQGERVRVRLKDSEGRRSSKSLSVKDKVKRVILGIMTAAVAAMVFGADMHDVAVDIPRPSSVSALIGEDGNDDDPMKRLLDALSHEPLKKKS